MYINILSAEQNEHENAVKNRHCDNGGDVSRAIQCRVFDILSKSANQPIGFQSTRTLAK